MGAHSSGVAWLVSERSTRRDVRLYVGEGSWKISLELLRLHPKVEADCIDASQQMLRLARTGIERESPESAECVRFVHQDDHDAGSTGTVHDLLVNAFRSRLLSESGVNRDHKKAGPRSHDERDLVAGGFLCPAQWNGPLSRSRLVDCHVFVLSHHGAN